MSISDYGTKAPDGRIVNTCGYGTRWGCGRQVVEGAMGHVVVMDDRNVSFHIGCCPCARADTASRVVPAFSAGLEREKAAARR